ncbi:MAG: AAA family ATPase [Gammaproteobacteria bacterium]|nr:AAA family ATPase [Gammaproteobacteria bacterium]
MYESFYGLKERPFSLLPDPTFLYRGKKHHMALTMLEYGLLNQAGITVITGEVGSGKTMIIRKILNQLDESMVVGLISNTHKSFGELLQRVLLAFDLEYKGKEKVALYHEFEKFVINTYAQGRKTVLMIDEAQNLAPETLEELRMLSNINADKDQVLQLVLVGQPELRATLRRSVLRQFSQRVTSSYHIEELDRDETRQYIQHRIDVAGGKPGLFQDSACDLIWKYSHGTPRVINTICDMAMVFGYAEQKHTIGLDIIAEVIREKQKHGFYIENEEGIDILSDIDKPAHASRPDSGADVGRKKQLLAEKRESIIKKQLLLRVAIASDSAEHQTFLKKVLEANQLNVTALMPISERFLGNVDRACADILLVDLDESMEMVPGHLDYLFENLLAACEIPILFNDGSSLKKEALLSGGGDELGKELSNKLRALVDKERVA